MNKFCNVSCLRDSLFRLKFSRQCTAGEEQAGNSTGLCKQPTTDRIVRRWSYDSSGSAIARQAAILVLMAGRQSSELGMGILSFHSCKSRSSCLCYAQPSSGKVLSTGFAEHPQVPLLFKTRKTQMASAQVMDVQVRAAAVPSARHIAADALSQRFSYPAGDLAP